MCTRMWGFVVIFQSWKGSISKKVWETFIMLHHFVQFVFWISAKTLPTLTEVLPGLSSGPPWRYWDKTTTWCLLHAFQFFIHSSHLTLDGLSYHHHHQTTNTMKTLTLEFSIVLFFVKHISEVYSVSIRLQEHVLEGTGTTIHFINHWLIEHYYWIKKAVALIKSNASIGSWPCNCCKHYFLRLLVSVAMVVLCCTEVLFKMSQTFTNKVCLRVLWVISAMGMMGLLQWMEYWWQNPGHGVPC